MVVSGFTDNSGNEAVPNRLRRCVRRGEESQGKERLKEPGESTERRSLERGCGCEIRGSLDKLSTDVGIGVGRLVKMGYRFPSHVRSSTVCVCRSGLRGRGLIKRGVSVTSERSEWSTIAGQRGPQTCCERQGCPLGRWSRMQPKTLKGVLGRSRAGTIRLRVRAWEAYTRWLLWRRERRWPTSAVDVVDYVAEKMSEVPILGMVSKRDRACQGTGNYPTRTWSSGTWNAMVEGSKRRCESGQSTAISPLG